MDITNNRQQQEQQRKTSKGRQKIEIKKVEKINSRYVTFSKRKSGIFKKATELSTLCGADVAVILFSEHGKVFSFGNPDVDKVLDRYIAETEEKNDNCHLLESSSSSAVTETEQEQEYKKSLTRLAEIERAVDVIRNETNKKSNGEFWWNLPVDNVEKEELEGYKESLEELKKNVLIKIDEMASHNASGETGIINQFIEGQNDGLDALDVGFNFEY
ncbi:hypothetical protein JCGZ_24638 [Jatropha curcas]|uniref:MADS-box domain-containing protein n=1 Tax=Jatropha curcas TaxID=180498 RepID=A0A067L964_JATCU|nr:agamous-like MADS-box protein AGL62 [Jatropha curcas]KDP40639.1 hypothetical protein JCGZ_24638 [Jatropha curcas]